MAQQNFTKVEKELPKEQGTTMENVTSSQTTMIFDNTCPNSCLLTKKSNIPPVSELQDNSDLSIQNMVPNIPNHNIDFSQWELEYLRIKEEKLKQKMESHGTPDNNKIPTVKERIIELESKLSTEKKMLLHKEFEVNNYELEVPKAQSIVEILTEEKDWLCNQVKERSASLESLRSSCKSAETMVKEYEEKVKDAHFESLRDYLITLLAKKEERAKAVEVQVEKAVFKIEEIKKDLNQTSQHLQKNEAVHREMLVQWNQAKSELVELRDLHACTERELKTAQSQMKLIERKNQERQHNILLKSQSVEIQNELESKEFKQLLEIKYDAIKKEKN